MSCLYVHVVAMWVDVCTYVMGEGGDNYHILNHVCKCITPTHHHTPPHTTTTTDGDSTKNVKACKKDCQDRDTESASTISTYSSSDEEGNWWEKLDKDKPPPPPPRTELHHPLPSESTSVDDDPVQISDVKSSPLDDLSSSIAQALFVNSKKQSDLFAATTLANMSQDISKTIGEELSPSHTPNVSVIHAGNSLVMLQRSTPAAGATKTSNNDPSGSQTSAAKASQNVHKTKVQRPS